MHTHSSAVLFIILGTSCQSFAIPQNIRSSLTVDGFTQSPTLSTSPAGLYKPTFASSLITSMDTSLASLHSSFPSSSPPSSRSSGLQKVGLRESPSAQLPLFSARSLYHVDTARDAVNHPKRGLGVNLAGLIFGIIGGLLGVAVLALIGRTLRSCYRTPRRNLAIDHIDRYNLDRELEEIEEARRHQHPPPAYMQAPQYEETIKLAPSVG